MDAKPPEPKVPEIEIAAVTPEQRVAPSEKLHAPVSDAPVRRKRRLRPAMLLGGVAAIVGLAALATTAWVYTEMQREMLRISTEIAQLRLSLDLYAQRTNAAPTAASAASATPDTAGLAALENRLSILEQNWRGTPAANSAAPAALPSINGPTASTESDGDCLPSGMRILVAAGDSYPVCGTEATIEVMNVSNGYITLTDGTSVASGGTTPLVGTACLVGVTSGGDEATTGFAEIRVTC